MKDWEFAGLSFGGWIILIIWFFSGGLITFFLATYYADSISTISEHTEDVLKAEEEISSYLYQM